MLELKIWKSISIRCLLVSKGCSCLYNYTCYLSSSSFICRSYDLCELFWLMLHMSLNISCRCYLLHKSLAYYDINIFPYLHASKINGSYDIAIISTCSCIICTTSRLSAFYMLNRPYSYMSHASYPTSLNIIGPIFFMIMYHMLTCSNLIRYI